LASYSGYATSTVSTWGVVGSMSRVETSGVRISTVSSELEFSLTRVGSSLAGSITSTSTSTNYSCYSGAGLELELVYSSSVGVS